ncbi:hypothetical protein SK128_018515, partial [Halocaridina rubra]
MMFRSIFLLAVSHFWELSRHLHKCISLVSQFFYTQESTGLQNYKNVATKDTRSPVSNAGMIPEDDPKPEEEKCSEDQRASCHDDGSDNVTLPSPVEKQTSHMDVIKNAFEPSREDDLSSCNQDDIILQIEEMSIQLPDETPYGGNTVQTEEVIERNESNVADKNEIDFYDIDIQYLDEEELFNRLELVGPGGFEGESELSKVLFDRKLSIQKEINSKRANVKEMQILKYLNGVGGAPKLLAATQSSFVYESAGSHSFLDQICNNFSFKDIIHYNTLYKVLPLVKELHAMGISHNNLTPNNIMVDPETGKMKIVDFSWACKMGETGPFEYDLPKGFK